MEIVVNVFFIFLSISITELVGRILTIKRQSEISKTVILGISFLVVMGSTWFQAKILNIGQVWMRSPMNQPEYILETGRMYFIVFLILYSLAIYVTIFSKRNKNK